MTDSLLVSVPWETRNLQRAAFEVLAANLSASGAAGLSVALASLGHEHALFFVQARLGLGETCLFPVVQDAGFCFVEVLVTPVAPLARLRLAEGPAGWSVLPVMPDDAAGLARVREIAMGSFVDDRFHRDPRCPRGVADRRFALWVGDLAADPGVTIVGGWLDGRMVGFLARRAGHVVLFGFERASVGRGLGRAIVSHAAAAMAGEGITDLTTSVSVNNLPSLNLFLSMGCRITEPRATFHLWSPEEQVSPDA